MKKSLIKPAKGTLKFSITKSLWLYFILIPVFFINLNQVSWSAILFGLLLTFITVCLGHSIGLHRGVIHKTYKTHPIVQNVLVYLFVLSGLGGPISWLKLHYFRDYWQNESDCPRYFGYKHNLIKDFWWNLHLKFTPESIHIYDIPTKDLTNKWLIWLEKTWYIHNLILMLIVYLITDLNSLLVIMFLRIGLTILGHWYIGYASHKYGYERFHIDHAHEGGYNDVLLGLFSFGEGFHNNHHAHPSSAKFSFAWYEIDVGWYMILLLKKMKLIHNVKIPKHNHTKKVTAKRHKKMYWKLPKVK